MYYKIANFREIIRLDESHKIDDMESEYIIALSYQRAGKSDKARSKFKSFIEKYGSEAPEKAANAYFHIGDYYLKLKQYSKSYENFIKTLELNPAHQKAKYFCEIYKHFSGKS